MSISEPTIELTLLVFGVNWQLTMDARHEQAASFGVGGSVFDAIQVEFWGGQLGNWVEPASDMDGTVGNVTFPYCAARRVKSSLVVTWFVLESMVTMPNWPSLDWAGK